MSSFSGIEKGSGMKNEERAIGRDEALWAVQRYGLSWASKNNPYRGTTTVELKERDR